MKNSFEKELEALEKQLKTKMFQHKMLSDTMYQMISKDANNESIARVKYEMDDTLNEVNRIKKAIEERKELLGRKEPVSFYDSIKKEEEDSEEVFATYDTPYNRIDIERVADEETNKIPRPEALGSGLYDGLPFSNRFIVDLDCLGIESWMICSVDFAPSNVGKKLYLTIYNHLVTAGPIQIPVSEIIEDAMGSDKFNMSIKYIDPTGVPIYVEDYNNCTIVETTRSPLTYAASDPTTIEVTIDYESISYDVNDRGEESIFPSIGSRQRKKIIKKRQK